MTLVATTKLHLPDELGGAYLDPGQGLPEGVDGGDERLAELLNSGALKDGETTTPGEGNVTRMLAKIRVEKYEGGDADARAADPEVAPDDVHESEDNLLLIGGASALWEFLIGNPGSLTAFSNANAQLGVGDSSTAAADTQTDLQAATNKLFKAMDATYPLHTHSTSNSAAKSCTFKSTFATTDANWAWLEWVLKAGTLAFNRKQESLGTKTSAASWVLTITLSLA